MASGDDLHFRRCHSKQCRRFGPVAHTIDAEGETDTTWWVVFDCCGCRTLTREEFPKGVPAVVDDVDDDWGDDDSDEWDNDLEGEDDPDSDLPF